MLEASREFVVLLIEANSLGGLVRKLAELRQPDFPFSLWTSPKVSPPNDGLEVIQNAVQSLAAASSVSLIL